MSESLTEKRLNPFYHLVDWCPPFLLWPFQCLAVIGFVLYVFILRALVPRGVRRKFGLLV